MQEENSIYVGGMAERSVKKSMVGIAHGGTDLFVISGGPIKIIELFGIVVVQIQGASILINYVMDPTSPAGNTAFATDGTALEINGDLVGALYTWDGIMNNDLVATVNGVALGLPAPTDGSTDKSGQLIVPVGSLELAAVNAGSSAKTGDIDFYLRYKPMVPGATVSPA